MNSWDIWNEIVPTENRIPTKKKNNRKKSIERPTHIVIHITGDNNFEAVKNTFLNVVSAHYLIDKQGKIYQFVKDIHRAWHAGVRRGQRQLYKRVNFQWMNYIAYFQWYRGYPDDAVYVDEDLNNVRDTSEASFVKKQDTSSWELYDYFKERWPNRAFPINFEVDSDPNNYSIGIECLSIGAKTRDSKVYTEQMYNSLNRLIENLCEKYMIPRSREFIVGHEDVNPIARFGWDPNFGFEWDRLM